MTMTKNKPYCGHCVQEHCGDHILRANNRTAYKNWFPPCSVCLASAYAKMLRGNSWEDADDNVISTKSHVSMPAPPPPGLPPQNVAQSRQWQTPFLTPAPSAAPTHQNSPEQSDQEDSGQAWTHLDLVPTMPVTQGVSSNSIHVATSDSSDDGNAPKNSVMKKMAAIQGSQSIVEAMVRAMSDEMDKQFELTAAVLERLIQQVEKMDKRVKEMDATFKSVAHAGGRHGASKRWRSLEP